MNDNDAFERQIADELSQMAGPGRRIDAVDMTRRVATAPVTGRWSSFVRRVRSGDSGATSEGGFSMFSAVKLVAAAAIVALFGSFLVAGVLTTPEEERAPIPAATTDGFMAGLTTKEVEPGVSLITGDGYHDLTSVSRSSGISGGIAVNDPERIWLLDPFGRLFRLGDEETYELADQFLMDFEPEADGDHVYSLEADSGLLEAGPDGRLWLLFGNEIFFFDPDAGTWDPYNSDIRPAAMAVDGSGTVWASLTDELVRFDADRMPTRYTLPQGYREIESLLVSPDGVAQVTVMPSAAAGASPEALDVLRLVDDALVMVGTTTTPSTWPMAAGVGGVLWTGDDYDWESEGAFPHRGIKRLDEDGWTIFTAADGVMPWGGKPGFYPWEMIAAAPDGSVWVDLTDTDSESGCDGLGRFDGDAWTPYLAGHCIRDIDFTTAGDAWVLAEGPHNEGSNEHAVFVIRG